MDFYKRFIPFIKKIKNEGNKKKTIDNIIIIIMIGVILIIAGGAFTNKEDKSQTQKTDSANTVTKLSYSVEIPGEVDKLEADLSYILSIIKGAGKVEVMLTLEIGREIFPAADTSSDSQIITEDNGNGVIKSTEENSFENKIVFEDGDSGSRTPFVLKEIKPVIRGVVAVADGANDPSVKEDIVKAIEVLTGVPLYRIQVFMRK